MNKVSPLSVYGCLIGDGHEEKTTPQLSHTDFDLKLGVFEGSVLRRLFLAGEGTGVRVEGEGQLSFLFFKWTFIYLRNNHRMEMKKAAGAAPTGTVCPVSFSILRFTGRRGIVENGNDTGIESPSPRDRPVDEPQHEIGSRQEKERGGNRDESSAETGSGQVSDEHGQDGEHPDKRRGKNHLPGIGFKFNPVRDFCAVIIQHGNLASTAVSTGMALAAGRA
jgi:hypothetical protein